MFEEKEQALQPQLVELYNDLLTLSIPEDAVSVRPAGEEVREQWTTGTPLIRCAGITIDPSAFFELMGKTRDIMRKFQPERLEDLDLALKAMPLETVDRQALINSVIKRDSVAIEQFIEEHQVAEDVVTFLLSQTLRPFMQLAARKLASQFDYDVWHRGTCPVCGGHPNMARFTRGSGQRKLYCSLCECEWYFKRIGCPYCDTSNHKVIRYFTVDKNTRYRVYICDACKGYIKTVDDTAAIAGQETKLFWEDAKTINLDLMAMEEGYINKSIELPAQAEDSKGLQ
ncbi:MAG: formate dehydrogenase accessory protein FdhE [Eubacteriales bacterium]|jgi:FdhE protein|nr:formate dehydrogenase accessory protein FdhE [Bacillota bacterium]MBV1727471.1 formate dehydrogenase accessory protein FdhE [Desulforudis sp.]MDP3049945.1 formate dehydrogenase accessory protein FdhE [Eubacteriales bacterium]MDQ7790402.1 formate dehydrogenase accessory protein FdhE [Clostridia bacterium]MBU4532559.1 formate dehydrogenase accessory protein FdhE [Bacillota bacterium]